jgi:hypothetical protein
LALRSYHLPIEGEADKLSNQRFGSEKIALLARFIVYTITARVKQTIRTTAGESVTLYRYRYRYVLCRFAVMGMLLLLLLAIPG